MAKNKESNVTFEGKKVVLKELVLQDILDIMDDIDENNVQTEDLLAIANKHLDKAVNLKIENFLKIPPSEIKEIYEDFKEVNSVFFEVAGWMGGGKILARAKEALERDLSKLYATLLKQVTQES